MVKVGPLTPEIAAECAWDANPEIRLLVGAGT